MPTFADALTATPPARVPAPSWRPSYVLVFVSIATAIPVGAIATESMSPRPCHGSE